MFIKIDEWHYLHGFYERLDEEGKQRFLLNLLKSEKRRRKDDLRIELIIGENLWKELVAGPEDVITRAMIRKAYRKTRKEKK